MEELQEYIRARCALDPKTGCWVWTRGKAGAGYGVVRLSNPRRKEYAHRLAYLAFVGPPRSLHVCHACDNPACVNPKHMFLGTQAENMADMRAKGRGGRPPLRRGETHGRAKLSEEDVRKIRSECAAGKPQHVLGREYGISQAHVSLVVRRESWKHI